LGCSYRASGETVDKMRGKNSNCRIAVKWVHDILTAADHGNAGLYD